MKQYTSVNTNMQREKPKDDMVKFLYTLQIINEVNIRDDSIMYIEPNWSKKNSKYIEPKNYHMHI